MNGDIRHLRTPPKRIEIWPQVRKYFLLLLAAHIAIFNSYAAPTGDEPLTPDEAVNILEEILEAQNHSYALGLKLKLPLHVVDAICENYSQPRDRLLHVLIEFTKQEEPRPTWRAIVDALRSPAVNLHQLAMTVEAANLPDPTATRDAPPKITSTSTGIYCLNCV